MAEGIFDFPVDFLKDFIESDPADICKEALKEAGSIYADYMKKSMKKVIEHEGDSDMVESVKPSKILKNRNRDGWTDGYYVNIQPTGESKQKYYYGTDKKGGHYPRKYPVSNALKAIWKEYGIPGRQKATPFIVDAKIHAEKAVMDKLQEVYNRKIGADD